MRRREAGRKTEFFLRIVLSAGSGFACKPPEPSGIAGFAVPLQTGACIIVGILRKTRADAPSECPAKGLSNILFFHPDYTVGAEVSTAQPFTRRFPVPCGTDVQCKRARGLYRRSGIAPCPEDFRRKGKKIF